jgi:hypothetical protein
MATSLFASPLYNPRFRAWNTAGTAPLSGGKVYVYLAGTTTATNSYPTYTDAVLGTNANANPVVLDANGEASIFLPVLSTGTGLYKIIVQDASSVVQWTADNVNPSLAYASLGVSEWTAETGTYSYNSASSFIIAGVDLTARYHAGRRIQYNSSFGIGYGTVTSSSFSTNTTVNFKVDSGKNTLGTLMSALYYGLLSYDIPSYLDPRTQLIVTKTSDMTGTFSAAVKVTGWTTELDALTEWGSDKFTARYPGLYSISMTLNLTDTSASQGFFLYFAKNGTASTPRFTGGTWSTGGTAIGPTFTRLMSLAASDTIEMQVLCTNNTTIKATHTVICIHRVA